MAGVARAQERNFGRGSDGDAGVRLARPTTCLMVLVLASALLHGAANNTLAGADQLLAQGRHAEACQLYERAIAEGAKLDSDVLRSRNLARCYLNQSPPRLNEAIRWLQNAVRLDPGAEDVRDFLAQTLTRANNFSAAAGQYLILSQAHPDTADYVLGLAGALRQAGRSGEALRALKGALERSPNLTGVRLEYANALLRNQQLQSAKEQYRLLLAADPGDVAATLGLATIASRQGDHQRALDLYNQVLQQHPGTNEALAGKALSLLWLGRKQEAMPLLLSAFKRNPDDARLRDALRDVGMNPHTASSASDLLSPQAQKSLGGPHAPQDTQVADPGAPSSQPTAAPAQSAFSNAVARLAKLLPRTTIIGIIIGVVVLLCGFAGMIRRRKASHSRAEMVSLHLSELAPPPAPTREAVSGGSLPDQPVAFGAGPGLAGAEVNDWVVEAVSGVAASDPAPVPSAARENGLRIIVVGGRVGLRQLEVATLRSAGLTVESVENFPQALLRWLAHPDAVVLINEEEGGSWDIQRVHNWVLENRPDWIQRTVFAISNPERFSFARANNIVHLPFGTNDMLECLSRLSPDAAVQSKAGGL